MSEKDKEDPQKLGDIKKQKWGDIPEDNFGYASDEERREKRGLEDWEMVENIPEYQGRVPRWFFAVIAVVLLVAIGLSFPFWGLRPGDDRPWFDWGFGVALLYIAVFGSFVAIMVAASSPSKPKKKSEGESKEKSEEESKDSKDKSDESE
jgi:hypothetical protein